MKRALAVSSPFRYLAILTGLLVVAGCGKVIEGEKITTPPPLEQAQGIAIAPFIAETTEKLGRWVPVRVAENFELKFKNADKNIQFIYDQSQSVNPVASKLEEMGVTLNHMFEDVALAAKVGRELNADFVVVGKLNDPTFASKGYNALLRRRGRQAGISGSATYVRTRLSAHIRAWIKVIDTKSGQLIFNNSIRGYIKYWYAYQTEQRRQVTFKTDTEMQADLGQHLSRRIAYALDPIGMPEVKEGEVLRTPPVVLLGTGGVIRWD
jgi:hypothetical protein